MTIPHTNHQYSISLFDKKYTFTARSVLWVIITLAILLRVASALFLGNMVTELPGTADQISYDSLAQRVAGGYGFSFGENHWPMTRAGEPTAHWSYLYTTYLAVVYTLFGHQPVVARLLQAILVGVLHTYLTCLIAEKIFSKTVGLVAAALSAFYIYFVYYSGALMTEPFYITSILWCLYLAMQLAESDSRRQTIKFGIGLGFAIAVTIIFRQVFLLFIPFMFIWIWFSRLKRGLSLPVVSTALSFAIIAVCVLPISLYNQSRFGRFVLLNTNSGYAFFWGNHPVYGYRFIPILPGDTYRSLIPNELHQLDEAALDQALLQRGMQFVFDDPVRYIVLSISRIPAYFEFWPSPDSSLISNISRVASFGITLPFMIYGVVLSVKRRSVEMGNHIINLFSSQVGLLILFTVIYTGVHLLTWALVRYRLPVDAVLLPFAALAVLKTARWVGGKVGVVPVVSAT